MQMPLRAACRLKRVWDAVEDSRAASSETTIAAIVDARGSINREQPLGIITTALGDVSLRVVIEADDDPARMMKLLDVEYMSSRNVSRITVQTQLFRMSYTGQNMSTFIDQYTSLCNQVERVGKDAAIPENYKAPRLLALIDPSAFSNPLQLPFVQKNHLNAPRTTLHLLQ